MEATPETPNLDRHQLSKIKFANAQNRLIKVDGEKIDGRPFSEIAIEFGRLVEAGDIAICHLKTGEVEYGYFALTDKDDHRIGNVAAVFVPDEFVGMSVTDNDLAKMMNGMIGICQTYTQDESRLHNATDSNVLKTAIYRQPIEEYVVPSWHLAEEPDEKPDEGPKLLVENFKDKITGMANIVKNVLVDKLSRGSTKISIHVTDDTAFYTARLTERGIKGEYTFAATYEVKTKFGITGKSPESVVRDAIPSSVSISRIGGPNRMFIELPSEKGPGYISIRTDDNKFELGDNLKELTKPKIMQAEQAFNSFYGET
jgi:hypothetical protein